MIGVLVDDADRPVASEFFELFKTPWKFCHAQFSGDVLLSVRQDVPPSIAKIVILFGSGKTARDEALGIRLAGGSMGALVQDGDDVFPLYRSVTSFQSTGTVLLRRHEDNQPVAVRLERGGSVVIRVGFDLFAEVRHLLAEGQPPAQAAMPTLDWMIGLLRRWILECGLPLVEIPPVPAGYSFFTCLTHDVDFIGIRQHRMDHTFFGFLYRASIGSLINVLTGRVQSKTLIQNWLAVAALPLVQLGLIKDYWDDFEAYREIEKDHPSTFFIIPFKHRPGEKVLMPHPKRRATRYDVEDVRHQLRALCKQGFEIGLHGIDAWHDPEAGRIELNRIYAQTGQPPMGVRMHWLCFDTESPRLIEEAGFVYDSTFGFNDAVGYRAGTSQVFRPLGVQRLLELPLHIQDVALFARRTSKNIIDAWQHCRRMVLEAIDHGGVLTLLWHTRSLGPEKYWGGFYRKLIDFCITHNARIANAKTVVDWFYRRRAVKFNKIIVTTTGVEVNLSLPSNLAFQDLQLRIYYPTSGLYTIKQPVLHEDVILSSEREQFESMNFCKDEKLEPIRSFQVKINRNQ